MSVPNALFNRDAVIQQWREAQTMLTRAKETEKNLRELVLKLCFPTINEGVNRFDLGSGYALKCTGRMDYKLDSDMAKVDAALDTIEKTGNEGAFLAARLVKWKPELSSGEYKKLDASNPSHVTIKAAINTVLTIKPGMPSLELEEPKGNGK